MISKFYRQLQSGLTLLELVIVIGLMSFFIPIVMILILNVSRLASEIDRLRIVKANGDNISAVIAKELRTQAEEIKNCNDINENTVQMDYLVKGQYRKFLVQNEDIYLIPEDNASYIKLNDNNVKIIKINFSCENYSQKNDPTRPLVGVKFTVQSITGSPPVQLTFRVKTKLRH